MTRSPRTAFAATLAALLAPTVRAHEATAAAPDPSTWWVLGLAVNLVMAVTFVAIAVPLWQAIREGGQFWSNPLLTGFFLIFTTCAVSHAMHVEHALLPYVAPYLHHLPLVGEPLAYNLTAWFGVWARNAMADPLLLAADVATAGLGVWYFLIRRRQSRFFEGAELAEDLEAREREAHAMHDAITENVHQALLLLEMGREEEAKAVVDDTLENAQGIVDDLLEAATLDEIQAGDLAQDVEPEDLPSEEAAPTDGAGGPAR